MAAATALLAGCGTVDLYATRAAQMHEPKAPRLKEILLDDQPAIVVHLPKHGDWKDQPGMVWLEEAISGKAVWSATEFMRAGTTHCFIPPGLKPGTYIVTLKTDGEPVVASNFDVK